jgi:polysaccharide lyase-like protein
METADLSQWTRGGTHGGSFDSGACQRPPNGVSNEVAHSGQYAMKMTINLGSGESGCRQFRHEESISGGTYYYGAWFYLPSYVAAQNYWNVFQFKSETSSQNDPFWVLDIMPRSSGGPMSLRLRWKGTVVGPFASDTSTGTKTYTQRVADLPVGTWFHVEVYLKQASDFTGRLTVWQNGKQLYDMANVKTKYPGGDERWSVNNYSDGLLPSLATLFVDDATVAKPL